MNFQYISDNSGNKTAVVIPISVWENIPEKYKNLEIDSDFNPSQNLTSIEFINWVNDAEKSADMTFEEYNAKWKLKRANIQSLTS